MKITPIITSILVNAFAVVGFISVFFVLFMKLVLGDQPRLSCINDRVFDFVASHQVGEEKYELIRYPYRISEGKSVFVLYNRKVRVNGCVLDHKQLAMEIVGARGEKDNARTYPEKITVQKNGLKVTYGTSVRTDYHSLPIVWDIQSKMAAVH